MTSKISKDRRSRERAGRSAEWLAVVYLALKGYSLVERRYRTSVGEIDLIVRRGRTIAVVEVKYRSNVQEGFGAITRTQMHRIVRAMQMWTGKHPEFRHFDVRFDALVIAPWRWPQHLCNAFDANVLNVNR